MSRLVTTTQVQLFPPLYLIKRFADAERVVILDEAQYHRDQFMDCFEVKQGDGRLVKIKAPLVGGGSRQPLNELAIQGYPQFREKLKRTLLHCYGRLPMAHGIIDEMMKIAVPEADEMQLAELCDASLQWMARRLRMRTEFKHSLDLLEDRPHNPSEWLARLTALVGGTMYFQGRRSMESYFDPQPFYERGIDLFTQEYTPSISLVPDAPGVISSLDAVLRHGWDAVAGELDKDPLAMEPWNKGKAP